MPKITCWCVMTIQLSTRSSQIVDAEAGLHFRTSTLALPWIFVLGQRFDHYECGRLGWLGQLYGAL